MSRYAGAQKVLEKLSMTRVKRAEISPEERKKILSAALTGGASGAGLGALMAYPLARYLGASSPGRVALSVVPGAAIQMAALSALTERLKQTGRHGISKGLEGVEWGVPAGFVAGAIANPAAAKPMAYVGGALGGAMGYRKGKKQEAAEAQEKEAQANMTGRDNRTPFVGGTQFPTEGSKSKAQSLHRASVGKAEVGPAPLMGELDKTKMVPLGSVVPKMPTAKGSLPKIGGVMPDKIASDPLVQYLKKHAKQIETNVDALATHKIERSLTDRDSDFEGTPAEAKKKEDDELLKKLFKNYGREDIRARR
jgi:hypothetical protein